jgi:bacteriocin-like protein
MSSKEADKGEGKGEELNKEQLDNVTGGLGISPPVRLKGEMTVKPPDNRSIAQQDSPYETDDNLPT